MRILVLDDSIRSLAFSLTIQNSGATNEIHMISEKTEVGLSDSLKPGTNRDSHTMLQGIEHHMPKVAMAGSFLRNSWVHRGLAIESVSNGLNIHFRSAVNEVDHGIFEFHGTAGSSFGASEHFDYVSHPPQANVGILWHGAVSTKSLAAEVSRDRGDGTFETWSRTSIEDGGLLQHGTWVGEEPNEAVAMAISEGVAEATRVLSSLK